jgi:hypothetical protein
MALKALVSHRKLKLQIQSDATEFLTSFTFGKALVDYVALKSVTLFTKLEAADIILDPYTLNLYFLADSNLYEPDGSTRRGLVTLSESLAYSISKPLLEAFELTEAVGKDFTLATVVESVTMAESFSKELTYNRAFADSLSYIDSETLAVGKNLTETSTITESSVYDFSKALTEAATVSDSPVLASGLVQSDSVSTADSPTLVNVFVRAFSDSYALDDTASASDDLRTDVGLNKNNVVTMSESLSFVMAFVQTLADSTSLAESASWSFSTTFTETPALSDSPVIDFSTSFADSTTISESILVELVIGTGAQLNKSALNTFALNS